MVYCNQTLLSGCFLAGLEPVQVSDPSAFDGMLLVHCDSDSVYCVQNQHTFVVPWLFIVIE